MRPAHDDAIAPGTLMAVVAMGLAVLVIAIDFSALSVALPSIQDELNADVASVQWVMSAYALVFGVFIVTGGRLADVFGRRRIFFTGAAIFATFSVAGGAAQDNGWLVAARALMGIGGAMMWPAILGMTYAALGETRAALAGALVIGVAGLGNAFGPLIGGLLVHAASWRWILFLNLPIAALACLVTWAKMHPPPSAPHRERIDYAGILTLSLGLVSLLLVLDQGNDWGFGDVRIALLTGAFAIFMGAFVAVERRAGGHALVPGDVLRNREFAAAGLAIVLLSGSTFAAPIYLPVLLRELLGYGALAAGAALFPLMAVSAVFSFVSGPLYNRFGPKVIASAGAGAIALGMLLLAATVGAARYPPLVPGIALLGLGIGLFVSVATTAGVTALGPARRSLAGGILYMFQLAGGSVGLALTTAVFTAASEARVHEDRLAGLLSEGEEQALIGLLANTGFAEQIVERFPGRAARLESLAQDAFISGIETSFAVVAMLALAGLLVAALWVGGRLRWPVAEQLRAARRFGTRRRS
jgi:EmrB/QacA subfamily drug resistance transporter